MKPHNTVFVLAISLVLLAAFAGKERNDTGNWKENLNESANRVARKTAGNPFVHPAVQVTGEQVRGKAIEKPRTVSFVTKSFL